MQSTASEVLTIVNPATGDTVATLSATSEAELDEVLARAATAQRTWWEMGPAERSRRIWALGEKIDEHHRALAEMDCDSMGKILTDAINEARMASRNTRYWGGMADKIFGEQLADMPGRLSYSVREPLGVYGVILPWNAPTHSFVARCVPAMACGNAVVVKPSELSPLSALRMADLALDAGLPEGLLSVVVGSGSMGERLVSHPRVAGISFTGSVPTGRRVGRAASEGLKPVTLELGGKSPVVVFDDADLDTVARAVLMTLYPNAGQICAAGSRLLVDSSVADDLTGRILKLTERLQVGDPRDPASHIGPVSCESQFHKVHGFITQARSEGATVHGGPDGGKLPPDGWYVTPTVLTDVSPTMTVFREEVFGPVLSVTTFDSEAEAIELANSGEYGLAAYVWTSDVGRMLRATSAVDAGVVHGNTPLVMDASLPFGGFKNSGVGNAYGSDAIAGCTQTKRVTLRATSEPLPDPWDLTSTWSSASGTRREQP